MKQPVPVTIYRTKRSTPENIVITISLIITLAVAAHFTQQALGIFGQHVTYWEAVTINVAVWLAQRPEHFVPTLRD